MSAQHHIFYVPGLGDPRYQEQGLLLKLWRIYGVRVHYTPMYWSDDRPFQLKLEELLEKIDRAAGSGAAVSLIGTSAGASSVINAYAKRKNVISGVVCICGKLQGDLPQKTIQQNPSFNESFQAVPDSLALLGKSDRQRILSLHPIKDGIVPIDETRIPGTHEKTMFSIGHVVSIAYAITVDSWRITRFLKTQARN